MLITHTISYQNGLDKIAQYHQEAQLNGALKRSRREQDSHPARRAPLGQLILQILR